MKISEKLSHFHATILVFMIQSGVAIFSLPQNLATEFGTNGWAAVLIFSAIVSINIGLISIVYRLGKGKSIFEILEHSVPKWILFPVYLGLTAVWSMIACLIAKHYVLIFEMVAFPTANPMAFLLIVDFLAFWLITMGLYNISKAATVFFWLAIWMVLLLFSFYSNFSWARLTPFFFRMGEYSTKGFYNIFAAFLGYELGLLLFAYTDQKTKLVKSLLYGNLITTVNYIYLSFIAFGFYSFSQLKQMLFPLLDLLAYIKFPFIERVENLFYGFFLFTTMISIVMYNWSAKEVCNRIFPKMNGNVLVFIIMGLAYAVSFIPDALSDTQRWLSILSIFQFWIAVGLPALLIAVLLVQRMRGRPK